MPIFVCPKHLLSMFIVLWIHNFSFSYTCVAYLPVSCIGAGQRILPAVTYSKNCSQFSNVTRGSELPYFSSAHFCPSWFWLRLPPCVLVNIYFLPSKLYGFGPTIKLANFLLPFVESSSKNGHFGLSKWIFYVKNHPNIFKIHWRISI